MFVWKKILKVQFSLICTLTASFSLHRNCSTLVDPFCFTETVSYLYPSWSFYDVLLFIFQIRWPYTALRANSSHQPTCHTRVTPGTRPLWWTMAAVPASPTTGSSPSPRYVYRPLTLKMATWAQVREKHFCPLHPRYIMLTFNIMMLIWDLFYCTYIYVNMLIQHIKSKPMILWWIYKTIWPQDQLTYTSDQIWYNLLNS